MVDPATSKGAASLLFSEDVIVNGRLQRGIPQLEVTGQTSIGEGCECF